MPQGRRIQAPRRKADSSDEECLGDEGQNMEEGDKGQLVTKEARSTKANKQINKNKRTEGMRAGKAPG